MIQRGIVSKGDIPTKADGERHSNIALTLLKDFTTPLSQDDEARLSVLCRSLPDETGSGMITFPGRFAGLDDVIEREIEGNFGGRPVRVREMAAANAVTSSLWCRLVDGWLFSTQSEGRFSSLGSGSSSRSAAVSAGVTGSIDSFANGLLLVSSRRRLRGQSS